jgi:hypothetical protein
MAVDSKMAEKSKAWRQSMLSLMFKGSDKNILDKISQECDNSY